MEATEMPRSLSWREDLDEFVRDARPSAEDYRVVVEGAVHKKSDLVSLHRAVHRVLDRTGDRLKRDLTGRAGGRAFGTLHALLGTEAPTWQKVGAAF